MQNAAIWLASIFGPLLTIKGLWMLLYSDHVTKVFQATKQSPALSYYSSMFCLLVGFGILSHYDLWDWNALLLITLLGWVFIIRGILGLFVPQLLTEIFKGKCVKCFGLIPLIFGLILCWIGFFV